MAFCVQIHYLTQILLCHLLPWLNEPYSSVWGHHTLKDSEVTCGSSGPEHWFGNVWVGRCIGDHGVEGALLASEQNEAHKIAQRKFFEESMSKVFQNEEFGMYLSRNDIIESRTI